MAIGCALAGLTASPTSAEWRFEGTARPSAQAPSPAQGEEASKAPNRIQVFGSGRMKEEDRTVAEAPSRTDDVTPERVETVEEYERVLREDRAARTAETDADFESVRARTRSRRVAEESAAPAETVPAPSPAAAPAKKPAARPAPAAPKASPKPDLETEVITPQKATRGTPVPAGPAAAEARGNELNPAFGYTHLLPSPFNLPQGHWVLGTTAAYGLLDFLQVSTNVARTFLQHWNVQAKVPLVEFPTFVASAYVGYESYNPRNIDATNPDIRLNRWQPGVVTGYEIDRDMAFFIGGNFNFGEDPVPVRTTSGYLRGAQVEVDWSWLYNPSSSRLGDNALAVGATYDMTYNQLGFGLTHHWRSFQLGVHYTLADRNRFLPIFGFSAGGSF